MRLNLFSLVVSLIGLLAACSASLAEPAIVETPAVTAPSFQFIEFYSPL